MKAHQVSILSSNCLTKKMRNHRRILVFLLLMVYYLHHNGSHAFAPLSATRHHCIIISNRQPLQLFIKGQQRSTISPPRYNANKGLSCYRACLLLRRRPAQPWYAMPTTAEAATISIIAPTTVVTATHEMIAWASMGLLAIQFGAMPTLQKKCVPKNLCRSSIVLVQEICKFSLSAVLFLALLSPLQRQLLLANWTPAEWWYWAGLPAALYAIQNYAKLLAYQHLPAVTYSVLNQTKTLSAAFFCFWFLGIRQSPLQMLSLGLLLLSALILEEVIQLKHVLGKMLLLLTRASSIQLTLLPWRRHALSVRIGLPQRRKQHRQRQQSMLFATTTTATLPFPDYDNSTSPVLVEPAANSNSNKKDEAPAAAAVPPSSLLQSLNKGDPYHFTRGVLPLLLANLTSGLAAALGQKALQHHNRNLYLYGMELASASFLLVLLSLLWSKDGRQLQREGLTRHWQWKTMLPISAHAFGGLLVGIVTKYAGSVKKGFALIFGVLLSGLFQKYLSNEPVTKEQIVGGMLACVSLWMHSSFPPKP